MRSRGLLSEGCDIKDQGACRNLRVEVGKWCGEAVKRMKEIRRARMDNRTECQLGSKSRASLMWAEYKNSTPINYWETRKFQNL